MNVKQTNIRLNNSKPATTLRPKTTSRTQSRDRKADGPLGKPNYRSRIELRMDTNGHFSPMVEQPSNPKELSEYVVLTKAAKRAEYLYNSTKRRVSYTLEKNDVRGKDLNDSPNIVATVKKAGGTTESHEETVLTLDPVSKTPAKLEATTIYLGTKQTLQYINDDTTEVLTSSMQAAKPAEGSEGPSSSRDILSESLQVTASGNVLFQSTNPYSPLVEH